MKPTLMITAIGGINVNIEDNRDISIDELTVKLIGNISEYYKIEQKHWWSKKHTEFDLQKLIYDIRDRKIEIKGKEGIVL